MIRKMFPALALALVLGVSCSDETTIFKEDLQEDIIVENNESALQGSISYSVSGVLDIYEEDGATSKRISSAREEMAGDYPLTLVAQVKPPTYQDQGELTASHVHVEGDYAYVSYNTAGETYFGGLDIINISNPAIPRLTSRLIYLNADINSLAYNNGYVYAAGGVDAEQSVTATSNAFVAKIEATGGSFNTGAGITYGFQQGFNANDIRISGDKVLVTSGKDGSLTVYSKGDLSVVQEYPYLDLRSIAMNGDKIALLDAGSGIKILDGNFQLVKEIGINTDLGLATKKTLDYSGDRIIVSEASKGAGIYSEATGNLLEYLPILINPEGVSEEDKVTNAVVSNEDIVLMANGGAGLCLSEENGNQADLVGIIELEGSVNYVQSKGDYVFAASGREGLQIIKLNRPSESLESKCATLGEYDGSSKLVVPGGQDWAFKGAKRFNNISVNGGLLLCGSWTVRNNVNINDNALFEYKGSLIVGRNDRRKDVKVKGGATLRIEGDLTIYGDLILEDGATLEFLGPNSTVNIFGDVDLGDNVTVSGEFEDVRNKF